MSLVLVFVLSRALCLLWLRQIIAVLLDVELVHLAIVRMFCFILTFRIERIKISFFSEHDMELCEWTNIVSDLPYLQNCICES